MSLRRHRKRKKRFFSQKRQVLTLEELFKKQKGKCAYCKEGMVLDGSGISRATVDHVVPKSRGGASVGNTVAACFYCNNEKADMTAEEYALYKLDRALERSRIRGVVSGTM